MDRRLALKALSLPAALGACHWALCESQLGATTVLQYEPVPGEFQGCVPLADVGKAWAG